MDIVHNGVPLSVFEDGEIYNHHTRKYLKFSIDCGYYRCRVGKTRVFKHQLIAKAFVPNPDDLPQINHIDGNKLNNDAENLEWVSSSANIKHAYAIGLMNVGGEKNPAAKLTEDDVIRIRALYETDKYTYGVLAEMFGVSKSTVYQIIKRKLWKHI